MLKTKVKVKDLSKPQDVKDKVFVRVLTPSGSKIFMPISQYRNAKVLGLSVRSV